MGVSSVGSGSSNNVSGKSDTSGAEEAARKAAEAARKATEASRNADAFQEPARRNTLATGGGGSNPTLASSDQPSFRVGYGGVMRANLETASTPDAQAKQYIESQFQAKLGRACGNPEEILAQANASGATSQEAIQEFVDGMIDGSPEKAALNTINESFKELLGRELSVSEQQSWLKGSGLQVDGDFARNCRSRIMASDEFRIQHPELADTSAARGQAAVDYMKQYLGQRTMDTPLNGFHRNDPDNNCANAVCAALKQAGLFNGKPADANVVQLSKDLQAAGWTAVDPKDARPGDVIIINGGQHTELVESNVNGHLQSIGSNNVVSASGEVLATQNISVEKNPWFMRGNNQVLILRAPPSGGAVPGSGTTSGTGTSNTGTNSTASGVSAPSAQLAYDGGTTYSADVVKLQQALVKAGYMDASVLSGGGGHYGDKTRAAVARLQADYGIVGDGGEHYGPRTRNALTEALDKVSGNSGPGGVTPSTGSPAPAGSYEAALQAAVRNAPRPGDPNMDRYWLNYVKNDVVPKLEAAGVSREDIKKVLEFSVTEALTHVGNLGYKQADGSPQTPISASNLGDNRQGDRTNYETATPDGFAPYTPRSGNWQVGIGGNQVYDAMAKDPSPLQKAFEKLYPGQSPQQVGQRMLELMGDNSSTFPNLSWKDMNGNFDNAKWASIILRDPAISIYLQTKNPDALRGRPGGTALVNEVFGS
ncbi:peptidoglycan-binding protein [Archangium violaceum]|uniref:peptidoglycan-binding domain-containing protein n=1 Tax=Archangium violaceum TaxID=83451 RepID=UPI00194E8820|nr:peptidoglycan-binding domain-containing protein [Archangium violaceum]QRN95320.1 peptidoglycan-binding protein [Archangium violaceum]